MFPAPLAGVRVLDLSQVVSGPICGRMLADLGADVVKVEPPGGDIIRGLQPQGGGDDPIGMYFTYVNAGKRDACIDLRVPEGADVVARLADASDVLLENFRPGVLDRRGLGADALLARNPRLVYCSITGWGLDGPWAQRRAYAPVVQAETGRVELEARLRDATPNQAVHVEGDIYPGLLAVSAILAALYQREHTGAGQHLDVAMAEALVYTDEWASTDLHGFGRDRIPDPWTYPVLATADGTGVAFLGDPTRDLARWAAALTDEPVPAAPTSDEALDVLTRLVAAIPDFPALEARLEPHGLLVGQVRSVAELAETPWAVDRGAFTEVEPGVRIVTAPFRSRHAPIGVQGPAPRHGEHTREVLVERLGLSDLELDSLEAAGAIVSRPRR